MPCVVLNIEFHRARCEFDVQLLMSTMLRRSLATPEPHVVWDTCGGLACCWSCFLGVPCGCSSTCRRKSARSGIFSGLADQGFGAGASAPSGAWLLACVFACFLLVFVSGRRLGHSNRSKKKENTNKRMFLTVRELGGGPDCLLLLLHCAFTFEEDARGRAGDPKKDQIRLFASLVCVCWRPIVQFLNTWP